MSLPKVGDIFEDFKILKVLGRGGMGLVYLAEDVKLSRKVALKFLDKNSPELKDSLINRFQREAKTLASFNHPNIVYIHSLGSDEQHYYLVMEYVEGSNLHLLTKGKKFEWKKAVQIMKGILKGLSEAHQRGVLHRDIKPENILIDKNSAVKIVDFGICKNLGEADTTSTDNNKLIGTVSYMAPEVIQYQDPSPGSDIFSAGLIFYQLLVGHHPFSGAAPIARMYKICNEQIEIPEYLTDSVPHAVVEVVNKMLAIDSTHRYTDVEAILFDLKKARKDKAENKVNATDETEEFLDDLSEEVEPDSLFNGGFDVTEAEKMMELSQEKFEDETTTERDIEVASIMKGEKTVEQRPFSDLSLKDDDQEEDLDELIIPGGVGADSSYERADFVSSVFDYPKTMIVFCLVFLVAFYGYQNLDQKLVQKDHEVSYLKSLLLKVRRSMASVSPVATPPPKKVKMEKGTLIKVRRVRKERYTQKKLFETVDEVNVISRSGDIIFSKITDGTSKQVSVRQFPRNVFLPPLRDYAKGKYDKKNIIVGSAKGIYPLVVGKKFDVLYNTKSGRKTRQYTKNCEVLGVEDLKHIGKDVEVFKVFCTTSSRNYKKEATIFYAPYQDLIIKESLVVHEGTQAYIEEREVIEY